MFNFRVYHPAIVLLDRGDCYLALKVWHAQQAGAAAVLVSDNLDEPVITLDFPEVDDSHDDEFGFIKNISIPSALIEKSFGDMLKQALNNEDEVLIKIDWRDSVPHHDQRLSMSSRATRMMNKRSSFPRINSFHQEF
uniref:Vacuolar-sorting receptor 7 n=1 Tax=Cajanus cajan TaxID=3821 RepID=A0A151SZN9_CAJCA|nr:Vacuolar-sorting receptor 7 [Cajanus cajan]